MYTFDEITNAYFYSSGGNLLTKFTNESPSAFKKETLRCLRGSESYKGSMLRMVYPINILNRKHLQLNVFGESLDKWILSNEFNGKLEKINDKLWVWIVDEDHMDDLNNYCGKAGILISWKPQIKKQHLNYHDIFLLMVKVIKMLSSPSLNSHTVTVVV